MKYQWAIIAVLVCCVHARAGGPQYVAGSIYFDPATEGTALSWSGGIVNYYTDRGDLSPALPGPAADALVGTAFSRWTSIATAAVSASHGGQLAEDVNGANVTAVGGVLSLPADIRPSAVNTPVGIVYDIDGSVTSALLGQGAGASTNCFNNAVFGGVDNLSTNAQFLHALVVINGNCAQSSAQIPDVQYRLVRAFGRILGLAWSQANINVFTRSPVPGAADLAGLPVMHAVDLISCVPVSICYPTPDQPKMDDRAAVSRLYPVTAANLPNFPGKQVSAAATARIHGAVFFTDPGGLALQPMQGVNVVARLIDPATGVPSRSSVASSVSGFLFTGNAGNPATGFSDASGQSLSRFGTKDPTLEGFFDLAGLELPNGSTSAQFQLSVEAVDSNWSQPVAPYGPWQVQPSGSFTPINVTTLLGGDVRQDILMQNTAISSQDPFPVTSYASPVALPASGDWTASLSGYGDGDYFAFPAQANHTLSVEALALNEALTPSESKAQPVIGIWALADLGTFPAPASTPLPFNSQTFGMSRLDAIILASTNFRLGIFDYRGDGRPDYRYRARVLYADSISPTRASVGGGTPLTVLGIGFHRNSLCTMGPASATPLTISANAATLAAPVIADGVQSFTISDPISGSSSTISNALIFGAGPADLLKLISGAGPASPVGSLALNPFRLQVVASDGVTPIAGASVALSSSPAASFSVCGGAAHCAVLSDDGGMVSTRIQILTAGNNILTAQLAPAAYPSPKTVQLTILGSSSALDVSLDNQQVWVAQGATVDLPVTARVLSSGVPVSGRSVQFQVLNGIATLSATSAISDLSGVAAITAHLANLGSEVLISACVQPGNAPCQNFSVTAVPDSTQSLQLVSGSRQAVAAGTALLPVVVRVTDSAAPPHSVVGANVAFQEVVSRILPPPTPISVGGILIFPTPAPVIISSARFSLFSDVNGLVIAALTATTPGSIRIQGTASAGSQSVAFDLASFAASAPPSTPQLSLSLPGSNPSANDRSPR